MEPITTTIVTALAAGAVAAGKDVATSAIKSAYEALKGAIARRFGKAVPFVEAVEANPESEPEKQVLANQLAGAAGVEELKELAVKLLEAVEQLRNEPRAQALFDFKKLSAAKNFELSNIETFGTLLRADEANFTGDFKATGIRQKSPGDDELKKK